MFVVHIIQTTTMFISFRYGSMDRVVKWCKVSEGQANNYNYRFCLSWFWIYIKSHIWSWTKSVKCFQLIIYTLRSTTFSGFFVIKNYGDSQNKIPFDEKKFTLNERKYEKINISKHLHEHSGSEIIQLKWEIDWSTVWTINLKIQTFLSFSMKTIIKLSEQLCLSNRSIESRKFQTLFIYWNRMQCYWKIFSANYCRLLCGMIIDAFFIWLFFPWNSQDNTIIVEALLIYTQHTAHHNDRSRHFCSI